jgi:hypothetical protein
MASRSAEEVFEHSDHLVPEPPRQALGAAHAVAFVAVDVELGGEAEVRVEAAPALLSVYQGSTMAPALLAE